MSSSRFHPLTAGLLAALLSSAPAAMAAPATDPAPPTDPYQPLAFLVGHCWKGEFRGDAARSDEHCFSRIYGGKFLRDEHVVHRAGKPDEFGETIYLWNSASHELEYFYIESGGGYLRGVAMPDGEALVFPAAAYVADGESMNVRSRWQRAGEAAYDVATEFEVGGRWVPGFSLRMQRE
jgi:hypothetical protein